MFDPTNFHHLVTALRNHPECRALVVWVDEDAGDFDPDTVDWDAVEDRSIETGHDVISWTGSPKETEA